MNKQLSTSRSFPSRFVAAVLRKFRTPITILAVLPMMLAARGDVRVPNVFGNSMVLQQGRPVPVWGWADPGESVTVRIGQLMSGTKATEKGEWRVELPALKAGGPFEMLITGNNRLTLKDVLVGEVWIGSGQSNMEWPMTRIQDSEKEIAAANYPRIRLFKIPRTTSGEPREDVNASWTATTPDTAKDFSAVLYFFGRRLHRDLETPIGLINTSWGGTRIEPWTPPAGFAQVPELAPIADAISEADRTYREAVDATLTRFEEWTRTARAAFDGNESLPEQPQWPNHKMNHHQQPTGLYNAMVHPIAPFAIRGAIWYQGESNRGDALSGTRHSYASKMRALVQGWREVWQQGDFPFYWVQLAPFRYGGDPLLLPLVWEAQTAALDLPETGMAVTTDLVDNIADIHPRNKQDVGKRLALWALANTYNHDDLVYSGPLFKSMAIEGNKLRLRFNHAGDGLKTRDGEAPDSFQIAGNDRVFRPANTRTDGDTVLVWNDDITRPVAVRFGWDQEANPNLVNSAGLPASPFRTDSW